MAEGTMIDMGDGFGGMSLLSGGAGFVGGLVLGSLWNGNGPWGGRGNAAANVFTSAIGDARVSKLKALCGLKDEPVKQDTQQKKVKNIDMDKFKGVTNGNTTSGK